MWQPASQSLTHVTYLAPLHCIALPAGVVDRPAGADMAVSERAGWDSDRDGNIATLPPPTETGGVQNVLSRCGVCCAPWLLIGTSRVQLRSVGTPCVCIVSAAKEHHSSIRQSGPVLSHPSWLRRLRYAVL